jgi:transposase
MIAFPAGVRVWIAGGVTDMRHGMNTLALQVQEGLRRDPQAGEIFCFRGRKLYMGGVPALVRALHRQPRLSFKVRCLSS